MYPSTSPYCSIPEAILSRSRAGALHARAQRHSSGNLSNHLTVKADTTQYGSSVGAGHTCTTGTPWWIGTRFCVTCECCQARGMPRGRAWHHNEVLSHQAWLPRSGHDSQVHRTRVSHQSSHSPRFAHPGIKPSRLASRVGPIATEGERFADREHRAPRILQTSSSGHLRPCGSPRTSFEGGFCARLRRRHHEVDARSSSRHSRGNHGRQCSRGGKVVPRDGFRSHKLVDSLQAAFDGVQRSPMTRRVQTYGHQGVRIGEAAHPAPPCRIRCRERLQDARRTITMNHWCNRAAWTQHWIVSDTQVPPAGGVGDCTQTQDRVVVVR